MTVLVSIPTKNQAQEELRAWSEVPDDLVDLGAAALAFGALRHARRETSQYREHLDRITAEVAQMAQTVRPVRVEQVAGLLREVIAMRHGYAGDEETYDAPDNANLLKVIDRRKGSPAALGIIYLAAARANGWGAVGLNFPEHFLIRLEFNGRRLIIDPFAKGEIVAVPRLRELIKTRLGPEAELAPEFYMPIGNKDVLLRLQNNLKLRYQRAGMDEAVSEVLESMLLLTPERANLWREFGNTLARLGQEHRAIVALENYLTLSGEDTARSHTANLVEQLKALTASTGA